jgi:hypothetical protein
MSDRTSAGLFQKIFTLLAENPTDEHKAIAGVIYSYTTEYDFNEYQMYADDACLTLGIARMGVNPEYPEDGEVVLWPSDPGYQEAGQKGLDK